MSVIITPQVKVDQCGYTACYNQRTKSNEHKASVHQAGEQSETDQYPDNVDHVLKLGEHAYFNVLHTNIMVERRNDFYITGKIVDPDFHLQAFRVLWRPHQYLP